MYMNGEQINHYANKMIHKKYQKKKSAERWSVSSWDDVVAYEQRKAKEYLMRGYSEYHFSNYWTEYYISGARKFAKDCSHRKMRRMFRQDLYRYDYEDIGYTNEHRYFDYDWTIY